VPTGSEQNTTRKEIEQNKLSTFTVSEHTPEDNLNIEIMYKKKATAI
jgi:hypothetical protein